MSFSPAPRRGFPSYEAPLPTLFAAKGPPSPAREESGHCLTAPRALSRQAPPPFSAPACGGRNLLQVEPEIRAVAEEFSEPERHRRRHRLLLVQNVVERLARDAERPGDLGFRQIKGGDHMLPEKLAGMRWRKSLEKRVGR